MAFMLAIFFLFFVFFFFFPFPEGILFWLKKNKPKLNRTCFLDLVPRRGSTFPFSAIYEIFMITWHMKLSDGLIPSLNCQHVHFPSIE